MVNIRQAVVDVGVIQKCYEGVFSQTDVGGNVAGTMKSSNG